MLSTTPLSIKRLLIFDLKRTFPQSTDHHLTTNTKPSTTETVVVAATPLPSTNIKYTRGEIASINAHLQALSCVVAKGQRGKTSNIKGVIVGRSSPFIFSAEQRNPAEAKWDTSDPAASKVHPSDEACMLINLEEAPRGLLTNIELHSSDSLQTSVAYIVKGQYLGRSVILVYPNYQHMHYPDSIAKELKTTGFQAQQIITTAFFAKKDAGDTTEGKNQRRMPEKTFEETLRETFPNTVATVYFSVRNIIIGQSGIHIIKDSLPQEFSMRWGETELKPILHVPAPAADNKLLLGDIIKQTIESLAYEYAKQNGQIALTESALKNIFTALQNSPLFKTLAEMYMSETDKDTLAAWPHVLNFLLSPLIIPLLVPSIKSNSDLVTRLHSYYYSFSHFYRQHFIAQIYGAGDKMGEIVDQITKTLPFNEQELQFLKTSLIYHEQLRIEHSMGHDTYQVVHEDFPLYSPFPFLNLNESISFLSIYGGYGHNSNPRLQAVIRKRGWHELVSAEFLREGQSYDGASHSYTCAAGLVEKFGFEPFARILHVKAYSYLGSKIVDYLLPAIAAQVKSLADLSVPNKQSLLNCYVQHFGKLSGSCYRAFPSLSRFIALPEDIDPSRQGSLGNYLAGIAELPRGEEFLSLALPEIGHLISSIEDLNSNNENSFCRKVLAAAQALGASGQDEKINWRNISPLLPYLGSQAELLTLLENITFWNDYRVNFNRLLYPLSDNYQYNKRPYTPKAYAQLACEIIGARTPSFSAQLGELIAQPQCQNRAFSPIFLFSGNRAIGLRDRFRAIPDYLEVMGLINGFVGDHGEMDLGDIKTIILYYVAQENQAVVNKLMTALGEVNTLLAELPNISPLTSSVVRRQLGRITGRVVAFRIELLTLVLDRALTEQEKQFAASNPLFKKILRIVSLVYSLTSRHETGKLSLIILKNALKLFFAYYNTADPASENLAYQNINQWLYDLDQAAIQKLLPENSPEKTCPGNRETRAELIAHGYSEKLWTEGVDVTIRLNQGLTVAEKEEQIRSASFELVEIALSQGVESYQDQPLTLERANTIDTYEKAVVFAAYITSHVFNFPKGTKERIEQIVEGIKIMAHQPIVANLEGANFRVVIHKDFFTEASAGVGVPGCFNPNGGIQRRMPLIHASEVNAGFVQIFNDQGLQIANAVIAYTKAGAYVLPNYSSSAYNLQAAYAEALAELTEHVPTVLMRPTSAGFSHLKEFAALKKAKIEKPATLFSHQAFDEGEIDREGNLTIEDTFHVVTKSSLRKRKAATVPPQVATKVGTFPEISWQALANQFLRPDYDKYPFLRQFSDPRQLLVLISLVRRRVLSEGKQVINNDFYAFVAGQLHKILPNLANEICDEVADLVIDFLEEQKWPIDIQSVAA
jgi:hypothetical protein